MRLIFKIFLILTVWSANLWSAQANLPTMDLFSSSTASAGQSLSLGDIVGALFVGTFTYITIVLPFLFGVLSMSEYVFKSGGGNGGSAAGSMTIIKFALTPLLWLVGGVVAFAIFHIFLSVFYHLDIYSWIKMFLEVRYETAVNNLTANGSTLSAAKSALLVLDVTSKIVFWSVPAIFGFLSLFLFGYIISIFLENTAEDSAFKKAFSGAAAAVVAFAIVGMYENSVSRVMFKNSPAIASVGSVSSAHGAFSASLKYWIRIGIGNG